MGFGNVGNLERCDSYEDAAKLFKSNPLRGKQWHDSERPLGTNRQYHYRVVKGDVIDCYRVWLYTTCMATFYAPAADGTRRVTYSWDNRSTSTQFMWHVVRVCETLTFDTTDGRRVEVPMTSGGVDLTLKDGRLDISRSDHPVQYAYRSSADDKARLAAFKKDMSALVQLAAIRGKDVETTASKRFWADRRSYGPFSKPEVSYRVRSVMRDQRSGPYDEDFIDALLEAAQEVVAYAKGRAAYDDRPEPGVAQLEKSIMHWLVKVTRMQQKSERVALPMFPEVK